MKKIPLLLHVPHASAIIPDEFGNDFITDLSQELLYMTDWFTDELFDCPAEKVIFPVSRLVCDPERFRDKNKEEMARLGMGACYTHGFAGTRIRSLSKEREEDILKRWYDPHHRTLTEKTSEMLEKRGECLIVDCHSFHGTPLPYEPDQSGNRPDICIGTDPFHTPPFLTDIPVESFSDMGYSVSVNKPYAGAIVPLPFYQKDPRVMSVMIEINRSLYIDDCCRKLPGFPEIKRDILSVLEIIAADQRIGTYRIT